MTGLTESEWGQGSAGPGGTNTQLCLCLSVPGPQERCTQTPHGGKGLRRHPGSSLCVERQDRADAEWRPRELEQQPFRREGEQPALTSPATPRGALGREERTAGEGLQQRRLLGPDACCVLGSHTVPEPGESIKHLLRAGNRLRREAEETRIPASGTSQQARVRGSRTDQTCLAGQSPVSPRRVARNHRQRPLTCCEQGFPPGGNATGK